MVYSAGALFEVLVKSEQFVRLLDQQQTDGVGKVDAQAMCFYGCSDEVLILHQDIFHTQKRNERFAYGCRFEFVGGTQDPFTFQNDAEGDFHGLALKHRARNGHFLGTVVDEHADDDIRIKRLSHATYA